jgi:Ni,Fe-hydrogenase III small subunit/ferredoxin
MPWIPRGLRNGIVTTGYPRTPDGYPPSFRGSIDVDSNSASASIADVVSNCPTRAISVDGDAIHVDRGKCVLCGRCVSQAPQVFRFSSSVETSSLLRTALVVPALEESDVATQLARAALARRVKSLHRSIHVRHVDAGSDGSDEWEVAALTNPVYDVQRLGIYLTASPRHADILLVTGVGSLGMAESLRQTFEVMPDPRVVVAAGVESISGELVGEGYASLGGVDALLDVDVFVPGSPATPFGLLRGILMAVDLLSRFEGRRGDGATTNGRAGRRRK